MSESQEISLVVLSHGLWGVKSHMSYIEEKLNEKYDDDSVFVLNVEVNEAKYSYDGIDVCGDRLADEVESTIVSLSKKGKQVKKISMIGYSLGGLILRYAIGTLGQRGLFNTIKPEYFITFATPHMGVKKPKGPLTDGFFNYMCGKFVSRTGEQFQLIDTYDKENSKTLLEILSDPDQVYFKNLAKFKIRRTYANIANDRTVPYWTSGMELMDYFYNSKGKLDITVDEDYVTIVTGFDERAQGQSKKTDKSKENRPLKPKIIKAALYCLLPLAPIWMIFVFTVVSTQGFISRYRVSRILAKQTKSLENGNSGTMLDDDDEHRRTSEGGRYVNGEILAGVLDAINLPGETKPSIHRSNSHHQEENTINDKDYYYKVLPSKSVEKKAKQLPLDEITQRIQKNLSLLEWERAWVYLRVFNAHGSIICRQKMYRTEGGEATIKHFLDTTKFS